MLKYSMKSDKRVMDLEECCHRYLVTFTEKEANVEGGVFQSINGVRNTFPLNKEIELTEAQWAAFKDINKVRHFLPEYDYNPFEA
jgi:hypothetical protein